MSTSMTLRNCAKKSSYCGTPNYGNGTISSRARRLLMAANQPTLSGGQGIQQLFGPGTQLYKAASSSPDVEVLASGTQTLLINKKEADIKVRVNDQRFVLTPYEVRLLHR